MQTFFFTALLIHNWYTQNCTYLVCTTWRVWPYANTHDTVTTIKEGDISNISQTLKKKSIWISGDPKMACRWWQMNRTTQSKQNSKTAPGFPTLIPGLWTWCSLTPMTTLCYVSNGIFQIYLKLLINWISVNQKTDFPDGSKLITRTVQKENFLQLVTEVRF